MRAPALMHKMIVQTQAYMIRLCLTGLQVTRRTVWN